MTAPKPTRSDGVWADELSVGQTFTSRPYLLTQEEITDFAGRYDPQPYHLDAEAGAGTFFDGLVASGWHTAAVTMRLIVDTVPAATGIVGAGGELAWPSAALPGDELHVETTVDDIRWSRSRPDRATVTVTSRTLNQEGMERQRSTMKLLGWARPR